MTEKNSLEQLNSLPVAEAVREFRKCCGSGDWAQQMAAERPFSTSDELSKAADRVWWSLESADWLEAFRSHPKIGEKKAADAVSPEARSWSADEQASISSAGRDTMHSLAELNQRYEEKFGYIYIVCATGKRSEEMLGLLRERMDNDPDTELRTAASEQAKITQLRLRKLIEGKDAFNRRTSG